MKLLLLLILVVFVPSCGKKSIRYQYDPKWDLASEIYDNEIGKKVFGQLKGERQLNVCESGFGLRGAKKIRCMHCGFDYSNEITLDEARKLLLETGNLYLKTINENERIRPFLENYPFLPKNIEITIFIYKPNDSKPKADKLRIITIEDGVLKYMVGDRYRSIICEETYDEAMAKSSTNLLSNSQ